MRTTIEISPEAFELLQRRAKETLSTPEQLAETVIRLHLGNSAHIEQRATRSGSQAYLRGTRIAVRHVVAYLKANHTVEEIIRTDLPIVLPAAIYEAVAYYYDHRAEIEDELAANAKDTVLSQLRETLPADQYTKLTGHTA